MNRPILKKSSISLLYFFLINCAYGQALFDSDEVLEFTLSFDMKSIMKDRDVESEYHEAVLNYQQDGEKVAVPLRIKTRGHFRKISSNCKYPPLRLNFAKANTPENSIFFGQDKTKLVTPCRGDEYVVNEYMVYKLYNLFTPKSFKARLVKVVYHDKVKDKSSDPYFGMLLEEEDQMANRNNMESIEKIGVNPWETKREDFVRMAVFQYLIGNTDWSVQYMQNIKFITDDSTDRPFTVPYDFDHAGIVRAPYANPAPELELSSTQQRRYRGYCIENMNQLAPVFETFNQKKEDIYALYQDNPNLEDGFKKATRKFLDKFYDIINDPKKAKTAFTYPCNESGTGNVIIKGLKEH